MTELLDRTALQGASDVVNIYDPLELDTTSTMTRRLASNMNMYRYMLLDRGLLRRTFDRPITRHMTRVLGPVLVCNVADRFATQLDIRGEGLDAYCFNRMVTGRLTIIQNGHEATCHGSHGTAFRADAGTRSVASDDSGRANLWINAGALERSLEQLVGGRLRRPLQFRLDVAWDHGLAASVAGLFCFLIAELARQDGLAGNAVALQSYNDLLLRTVLFGLPNNYSDRLSSGLGDGVPAYVRRADGFMRAHAADPIRMEEVAVAAGCSVRTLEGVYRRFRDTTPLAALHAIRLDRVHAALQAGDDGESTREIARRYGFTNRQRFRLAYERRFGEPPRQRGKLR